VEALLLKLSPIVPFMLLFGIGTTLFAQTEISAYKGKLESIKVYGESLEGNLSVDPMVHQYIPNLKKYKAIALDAGNKDMGINDTVRALDGILTNYGILHTSEIYEGDHVNRIAERLESKVLPFFGTNLSFTAPKK
jgi:hypothetical protein